MVSSCQYIIIKYKFYERKHFSENVMDLQFENDEIQSFIIYKDGNDNPSYDNISLRKENEADVLLKSWGMSDLNEKFFSANIILSEQLGQLNLSDL